MACQSKEAKKWLWFYLIHLIFDNFEVNYISPPESYDTNLITLYSPSFHKICDYDLKLLLTTLVT